MNRCSLLSALFCLALSAACSTQPEPPPVPTPELASSTPVDAPPAPASPTVEENIVTPVPAPTGTPAGAETEPTASSVEATPTEEIVAPQEALPQEFMFIQEPGNGSRVTSPLRVRGESNSTFEQNIVVRLVNADGEELALEPTTIQSDLGQRGPFEIEIPFSVEGEQNAFIQIFSDSPRDGGLIHLSSVGVTLADSGEENIVRETPREEKIVISQPVTGDTIRGGTVHVEGSAIAAFEQSLVIDILDAEGNTLVRQPVTVDAPDLGRRGRFSADISYTASHSGPGRIVVREVSPAFGGTSHLNSVEVQIEP